MLKHLVRYVSFSVWYVFYEQYLTIVFVYVVACGTCSMTSI
jgi:hypothetical protein